MTDIETGLFVERARVRRRGAGYLRRCFAGNGFP
jgi:hypothetical protein